MIPVIVMAVVFFDAASNAKLLCEQQAAMPSVPRNPIKRRLSRFICTPFPPAFLDGEMRLHPEIFSKTYDSSMIMVMVMIVLVVIS